MMKKGQCSLHLHILSLQQQETNTRMISVTLVE
uniref:Uncharacterized protein n=1 Tax=Rhizophora mucronata TaxID=61149 RepID=A0A2P2PB65_RHIMU